MYRGCIGGVVVIEVVNGRGSGFMLLLLSGRRGVGVYGVWCMVYRSL